MVGSCLGPSSRSEDVSPWAGYLTSLCVSFLMYKMEKMIVLTPWGFNKD